MTRLEPKRKPNFHAPILLRRAEIRELGQASGSEWKEGLHLETEAAMEDAKGAKGWKIPPSASDAAGTQIPGIW